MERKTQPYKHSLADKLRDGVKAVTGGSKKQCYILEHKIGSQYHHAGEKQKIMVDQAEIGRDPNCQVRYDEHFETVSRRHAAIVRDGKQWKLIPLSQTNPTLLNGKKVEQEWYLQDGDEIQCAVNGPKIVFIIPSGNKSTNSNHLNDMENLNENVTTQKSRHGCVTAWLIFIIAVNSIVACIYVFANDVISDSLPDDYQFIIILQGIISIANIVFAVMLFQWKKWGFWGFVISSAILFIVNLSTGVGIGQSVAGLAGVFILHGIMQIKKDDKTTWESLE